jgi:hypothetical protein
METVQGMKPFMLLVFLVHHANSVTEPFSCFCVLVHHGNPVMKTVHDSHSFYVKRGIRFSFYENVQGGNAFIFKNRSCLGFSDIV